MGTMAHTLGHSADNSSERSSDTVVVYIHGRGPKPSPAHIKRAWDIALFGQKMGGASVMAYYADILHREEKTIEMRVQSRLQDENEELNPDILLKGLKLQGKNREQAEDFARRMIEKYSALERASARPSGALDTKILPGGRVFRRFVAKPILRAMVPDTAAYLFDRETRSRTQRRLLDVLPKGTPFTLVSHSQGSIVAFDVLAKLSNEYNVRHLITLGSPLGIQEVLDFVEDNAELKVPECVHQWTNFADPLDYVALDKSLSDEFDPRTSDDGKVVSIVDKLIFNQNTQIDSNFDPHSATGYLSDPTVQKAVYGSIGMDLLPRFVVARDVAAEFVSSKAQAVLVELLEDNYPPAQPFGSTAPPSAQGNSATTLDQRARLVEEAINGIVASSPGRSSTVKQAVDEAEIERLERFVSAKLTPSQILELAGRHKELKIYAIWKSTRKTINSVVTETAIHVNAARSAYGCAGEGITWAVLDTGIDSSHPHFAQHSTIKEIWDCTKRGSPQLMPIDKDVNGHGTHVAGIIAGESNDSSPTVVRGMAPKANLIIYKVLDDDGNGEDRWIIKALDHIAASNRASSIKKIHGINLSLGGPFDPTVYGCGHSILCQELHRLWRSGVVVVTAAGNEGSLTISTDAGERTLYPGLTIGDPANLEEAIAVGSVNASKPRQYGVSAFSSRGPTTDGRIKPDVVAPGERILSCRSQFSAGNKQQFYVELSGTSMAAPHVSGLLAAFLSSRREYIEKPDALKDLLLRTSTDLGRDRYHQGAGLPNLMKMLLEA